MENIRREILPGVWLTALRSDKFKTGCLSISLLTQLDRETAAQNALIPYVLRRGSRYHTDMQSLAAELDGLYGSYMEPVVRKIGEIQCIGFLASFADDKYLPDGSCGVIAFGLKGKRDTAIKFMDSLKMINIVTHVADARTCVLHPASHTHRQLSDEQLRKAGIAPDLIRLSVGIEDVEDILDDIRQALDKI